MVVYLHQKGMPPHTVWKKTTILGPSIPGTLYPHMTQPLFHVLLPTARGTPHFLYYLGKGRHIWIRPMDILNPVLNLNSVSSDPSQG